MFLFLSISALAADAPAAIRRENIEWCDAWMPNMNSHHLPRVMLIGDSIVRGYFSAVEENLKGKAYVARISTSKAVGDPALLAEITTFLGQVKFDVVHFNIGMHGWEYTEAEYQKHLPELIAVIRKVAPGAKLIWANTTPIRKDREKGATNARIRERNRIAMAAMVSQGIPVDDLHAVMSAAQTDPHSDDVHFSKDGNILLGAQVAREVTKLLVSR